MGSCDLAHVTSGLLAVACGVVALIGSKGVSAFTSALVCQSASFAGEPPSGHASFAARRLAITFGVLAVAPFFLAFHGAPSGAETLVFACGFAPLAAAVYLLRTERQSEAHAIGFVGLIALSFTLWLGVHCGAACVIAWLVVAVLEACLANDRRLALVASVVAGSVLLAILVTTAQGAPASPEPVSEIFTAVALSYALIVAGGVTAPAAPPVPARSVESGAIGPFEMAARLSGDLVLSVDGSGNVLRSFGATGAGASLEGQALFNHVHVGDRPAFLKAVVDAAAGGKSVVTIRLRALPAPSLAPEPPRYRAVELRAGPYADGALVLLRESEPGQTACDVFVEPERAKAATAHDDYLAGMSHELRTPLNAIIGFSEMLSSHTLCPADVAKQREYARIIHQSGQHLLSVVNAILDMSKIRSGTFEVAREIFDVVPLTNLCCDILALKAKSGGVSLVKTYPEALPEVLGDRRACKQILLNLLSNAVKFTPEGGEVRVGVKVETDMLVLEVEDTGVGMGSADLTRLGDPFFQVRSARGRSQDGTGLGLTVVRGLVGLQGGTIAVESAPGAGTRVEIRLPLDGRSPRATQTTADIDIQSGRRPASGRRVIERRMKQSA